MPNFIRRRDWYLLYRPKLAALVVRWNTPGADDTRMLAIVRAFRLWRLVGRILDKDEFLSDFGVRSLSSSQVAGSERRTRRAGAPWSPI
jgi:hypothetical protein